MDPLEEVVEPIGQFLDRRVIQSLTNVDRRRRQNLDCNNPARCPVGHRCYPAADGCIIGQKVGHCCQFDTVNQLEFLRTVESMYRYAVGLGGVRGHMGTAPNGYMQYLGALIGRVPAPVFLHDTQTFRGTRNVFSNWRVPTTLDLRFANGQDERVISRTLQLNLVSLGMQLFRGMYVKLRDDIQIVNGIPDSIRTQSYSDNFFVSVELTTPVILPVNILSVTRNIKVSDNVNDVTMTELRVFEIIRAKLLDRDIRRERRSTLPTKSILDTSYINAGTTRFDSILEACNTSTFRGYILCRIDQATVIVEGHYGVNGIDISVVNSSDVESKVPEPPGFSIATSVDDDPKFLYISRY